MAVCNVAPLGLDSYKFDGPWVKLLQHPLEVSLVLSASNLDVKYTGNDSQTLHEEKC